MTEGWHRGDIGRGFSAIDRSTLGPSGEMDTIGFQALYGLAPFGKSEYWMNRTHTNNHYTTSNELWRNEVMSLWTSLATQTLIYQSCYVILSIVAPFLYTYIQNFNYSVENMTIIPAQPTLPGVNARTSSFDKVEFSATMREYGTMCMMPVSVLFDPMQNEQRRNTMIIALGFSLAAAFIQIVLIGFMMMGNIAEYCCNLGYEVRAEQGLDTGHMYAIDRRFIGAANMGLVEFLQEIDVLLRALKYPADGKRKRTYMLVTMPFLTACTTQAGVKEIAQFQTYYGFLQDRTTQLASGITSGHKMYQIPSDAPALKLAAGNGDITMVTVPQIPISPPKIWLPHVLEGIECVNQFYMVAQRERDMDKPDHNTHKLGLYNMRKDDYVWIKFSQMSAACGIWDAGTGMFSKRFLDAIDMLNDGNGPYIPTFNTRDGASGVRSATATHASTIQHTEGYNDEMPFTFFDPITQKTKPAANFHQNSESTLPTPQALFAAKQMAKAYPDATNAINELLVFAKELLDKVPSDNVINWLLGKAESDNWKKVGSQRDLEKAGPTHWAKRTTTHSKTQRDLGVLKLDGIDRVRGVLAGDGGDSAAFVAARNKMMGNIADGFGGGLAHQIHRLARLEFSPDAIVASNAKRASSILENLRKYVYSNPVLMNSDLFKRVPAWCADQGEASIAIVAMILDAVPAFVILNDSLDGTTGAAPVGRPDAPNYPWMTTKDLAIALASTLESGNRELAEWATPEYRSALVSHVLVKGADEGLANFEEASKRIDYVIATAGLSSSSRDVGKLLTSKGASEFTYGRAGVAAGTRLRSASRFASNLQALSFKLVGRLDAELNYDRILQIAAAKKAFDFAVQAYPNPANPENPLNFTEGFDVFAKKHPKITKDFYDEFLNSAIAATIAFTTSTTVAGLQAAPNNVIFVRTPIVLSRQAWREYYAGHVGQNTPTKLRLIPGDWRTGYASPLIGHDGTILTGAQVEAHFNDMDKVGSNEALMYISEAEQAKNLKADVKKVRSGAVDLTPADDLAFMGSHAGKHYTELTAAKIRHGAAAGSGGDHVQGDAFQGSFITHSSRLRFDHLYQYHASSLVPSVFCMLFAYLHMPTTKGAVDALGDAGFLVPVDMMVIRSIIIKATSIVVAADGCHQAVIGPPSVVQVQNSVNDEWRLKASARLGILPRYMGGCFAPRGTMINQCLFGLSTEFVEKPDAYRPKLSSQGANSNDACLLALAVPTTFSMGHHFSWIGRHMQANLRNLSRLEDAKETRRMPLIFRHFYVNYLPFYNKLIAQGSELRMAQVKKLFQNGKFTISMADQGTWLRKFAKAATVQDQFFMGPCAIYYNGVVSTIRGYGPLGEIRTQSKGAAGVYMGRKVFFPTESEVRPIGLAYA